MSRSYRRPWNVDLSSTSRRQTLLLLDKLASGMNAPSRLRLSICSCCKATAMLCLFIQRSVIACQSPQSCFKEFWHPVSMLLLLFGPHVMHGPVLVFVDQKGPYPLELVDDRAAAFSAWAAEFEALKKPWLDPWESLKGYNQFSAPIFCMTGFCLHSGSPSGFCAAPSEAHQRRKKSHRVKNGHVANLWLEMSTATFVELKKTRSNLEKSISRFSKCPSGTNKSCWCVEFRGAVEGLLSLLRFHAMPLKQDLAPYAGIKRRYNLG